MAGTFTTSAQKTVSLSKKQIIKMLLAAMQKDEALQFKPTSQPFIKQAKLKDGSKIVIAAFDKPNSKTLAMIDFKDIPATQDRYILQAGIRKMLDNTFT